MASAATAHVAPNAWDIVLHECCISLYHQRGMFDHEPDAVNNVTEVYGRHACTSTSGSGKRMAAREQPLASG